MCDPNSHDEGSCDARNQRHHREGDYQLTVISHGAALFFLDICTINSDNK